MVVSLRWSRAGAALAALLALLGTASPARGQNRFAIEGFVGTSLSAPTSLTIRQNGEPDLSFTARYETKPTQTPIYWAVRLSLFNERRGIDLQFNHQKLHLTNRPPEVQHFEVTHGFNLFTLAYRWRTLPVDLRLGGGVVLPHPEGTVRDRSYGSPEGGFLGRGWHTAGPAFLAGAGKRWEPVRHLLLATGAELVAAWAYRIPIADGSVDVSNVALHIRAGLGYAF